MMFAEESEVPPLPAANITEVESEEFSFALESRVAPLYENENSYYMDWYMDYEITFNKDVYFNSNAESDGYLFCLNRKWDGISLKANETTKILELGSSVADGEMRQFTYGNVEAIFNPFELGVFFTEDFLNANPDLAVKFEVKMYSPDGTQSYSLCKYTYPTLELPTATVTKIYNEDLTFAMNFKTNEVSEEQLNYYGSWYADFEIKANKDIVFNAAGIDNGTADAYLSGEYANFGWVNGPISEAELKAGEVIKVMETAAKAMNEPGLRYTFKEVYEAVKDFNCGIFLTEDFLDENPDIQITLELKLYNPVDPNESYKIGETYTFDETNIQPKVPTATITKIDNENLTYAMNFKADAVDEKQLEYYGDWYADFEIKANRDIVFNAVGVDAGTADGYLSGEYADYGWVNGPITDVELKAGEVIKIMETAATVKNEPGLKYTYKEVYEAVKDFNCGIFLTEEFLAENPDIKITLELKLYHPTNPNEVYQIGETNTFTEKPELPTATATKIKNNDLTFAMNFKVNEITDEQFAYYKDWFADFEISVNKEVTLNAAGVDAGEADGYLSGQYDGWNSYWVNVPITDVVLQPNEVLKIMEYGAELYGEPGLKYTFGEVYTNVQDFDCGAFFTEEFLEDNEDVVIKLELRMYNPTKPEESYVIGDTYTFTVDNTMPPLPTATVSDNVTPVNSELTFAKNFKVDEVTPEQLEYYGSWYADFEITVNKDMTLNAADENADGYLSGQYDGWDIPGFDPTQWFNVPVTDVTLTANQPLKIMETGAYIWGEPGLKYTFKEVYEIVKDFDCGMFLNPEFIAENPDLKVTLELRIYNDEDETESYLIGEQHIFTFDAVAMNKRTGEVYETVTEACMDANTGDFIVLLKDADEDIITITAGLFLDLDGHKLTTRYCSCFGNIVDYSEDNTGTLVVPETGFLIQKTNKQLPVKDGTGYRFVDILKFNEALQNEGSKYVFQPLFESAAHELLLAGKDVTGVTINVHVSWKQDQGTRTQNFVYSDDLATGFIESYKPATGNYGKMFTLTLIGTENVTDLTFEAVVVSDTGVEFSVNALK